MDPAVLLEVAPFALFPVLWYGILRVVGRVSAWGKLAKKYSSTIPRTITGKQLRFCSASIGMSNYSNCINASVSPRGLVLSVMFFFRPGHPQLLIPWEAFSKTEEKSLFGYTYFVYTIGNPKIATITPGPKLRKAIEESAYAKRLIQTVKPEVST